MSMFYNVKNRGASVVVYRIPEEGIRRSFAPGETKKISHEELEKLTYQPGGMTILTKFLQIQDLEAIAKMGMKVEPEYHMSEKDIVDLIVNGSMDSFLDALDFAPTGVIDLIKKLAISIPMSNREKIKALKAKTGFDLEAALKHIDEEKEENDAAFAKQATERRVKAEATTPAAATPGRRTEAPKYNVISKSAEENTKSAE